MSVIKKQILEISNYSPPLEGRKKTGFTRLDFNERTIPVSTHIEDKLIEFCKNKTLHLYPSYGSLNKKLADHYKVLETQSMITNGSDQALDIVIRACCSQGDEAIIPVPTFPIYKQSALIQGMIIHEPKFSIAKGYPTQEILELANSKTKLIMIPNPNNPTGTSVSLKDINILAKSIPQAAILIDECYYEYSGITATSLIDEFDNIFITRTFSKTWGLPSVRLGSLISSSKNLEQLLKLRGPYDVNQFAEVAVKAALEQPDYTKVYVEEVLKDSKPLFENFLQQKNIGFWPSDANFLLIYFNESEKIQKYLTENNILVRPKKDHAGTLALRITIGTLKQTKNLIALLDTFLS